MIYTSAAMKFTIELSRNDLDETAAAMILRCVSEALYEPDKLDELMDGSFFVDTPYGGAFLFVEKDEE